MFLSCGRSFRGYTYYSIKIWKLGAQGDEVLIEGVLETPNIFHTRILRAI